MRKCKGCGKRFKPQHRGHTFCNGLCYDEYIRQYFQLKELSKLELAKLMKYTSSAYREHVNVKL